MISIFVLSFGYCRDIIDERAYDKELGTHNTHLYRENFRVLAISLSKTFQPGCLWHPQRTEKRTCIRAPHWHRTSYKIPSTSCAKTSKLRSSPACDTSASESNLRAKDTCST